MKVIILSPDLFADPSLEGLFIIFGLLAIGSVLAMFALFDILDN